MVKLRRRRRRFEEGFSLVETIVALTVLLIGALVALSSMLSSVRLDTSNREEALARDAARQILEQIKATTFRQAFPTYNADPADDPAGAGTAPGATFSVRGLNVQPGQTSVGTITFPTTGGVLREDSTYADLGMPRDLDGDNVVDATSHASDYVVLPVRVQVQWRGVTGNRSLAFRTVICQ